MIRIDRRRLPHVLLALIVGSSFLLKLRNLGHPQIDTPDEVITAVISQNLLRHPLIPTLVDPAYLPDRPMDWEASHLWLFKPPAAFWKVAVGFAIFGAGPWTLRLPSAILSSIGVVLVYLIGKRWFNARVGLIAAVFQAFHSPIWLLVHGHLFSDHIDISLHFWTLASIYFLTRAIQDGQKRSDLILCGVTLGLAFLSKWHLSLFVAGLAATAWLLPKVRLLRDDEPRFHPRSLLVILIAFAVTVAPWLIYIEIRFPGALIETNRFVLQHLSEDMSSWAAPWDRLLFDYNIRIFYVFYPMLLAALVWALWRAVQWRTLGLWLALAWLIGTYLPNVLAHTKTPSSTLIGWPAGWLLIGLLLHAATHGDRWALGIWLTSALAAALHITNASIPGRNWGYGAYGGAIMVEHLWVLIHAIGALLAGAIFIVLPQRPWISRSALVIAGIATTILVIRWWPDPTQPDAAPRGYLLTSWGVTKLKIEQTDYRRAGAWARRLPDNAAFIVDTPTHAEARLLHFHADRTCYALRDADWREMARALIEAGALPYLVTRSTPAQQLPAVLEDETAGFTIYACTPAAFSAAERAGAHLPAPAFPAAP